MLASLGSPELRARSSPGAVADGAGVPVPGSLGAATPEELPTGAPTEPVAEPLLDDAEASLPGGAGNQIVR